MDMSSLKNKGKFGLKVFFNVVLPVIDVGSDIYFTVDMFSKGKWIIGLISGMSFKQIFFFILSLYGLLQFL